MTVWAVVVAGGHGRRFGRAKQFEPLAGRRVLDWSMDAARSVAEGLVVVLPAGGSLDAGRSADVTVHGGATRSGSVRAGLAALPEDADVVVVHDAARPLASPALFGAVLGALRGAPDVDGVIPVMPVTETIKRVAGDQVVATVARDSLVTVQTPQVFRREVLVSAHREGAEGTDDAALVEALGGLVRTVPGEAANIKLTTATDLGVAERHLLGFGSLPAMRSGLGFDVHPFSDEPTRELVLGGVTFPGARGLAGHSDGDVVCHAVADALLGACGLGDIGEHFSDRDEAWKGANSLNILARVGEMIAEAGWRLSNADCSVVLEEPRLAPHRAAMASGMGRAAGGPVSVKAKRAEGLGALGRGEGIACWATALVEGRR